MIPTGKVAALEVYRLGIEASLEGAVGRAAASYLRIPLRAAHRRHVHDGESSH
jgi:hypothetical protein